VSTAFCPTNAGEVDDQALLTAAQSAEILEADQLEQASHEPGGLSQGHPEQGFHGQANLDCGIAFALLPSPPLPDGVATQFVSGTVCMVRKKGSFIVARMEAINTYSPYRSRLLGNCARNSPYLNEIDANIMLW